MAFFNSKGIFFKLSVLMIQFILVESAYSMNKLQNFCINNNLNSRKPLFNVSYYYFNNYDPLTLNVENGNSNFSLKKSKYKNVFIQLKMLKGRLVFIQLIPEVYKEEDLGLIKWLEEKKKSLKQKDFLEDEDPLEDKKVLSSKNKVLNESKYPGLIFAAKLLLAYANKDFPFFLNFYKKHFESEYETFTLNTKMKKYSDLTIKTST